VDVLRDRPIIDCSMIGEPGRIVPYEGINSVELTEIRDILETKCVQPVEDGGKVKEIRFRSNKEHTHGVITVLAKKNRRDPFIERIRRVGWDGKERLENFLKNIGCSARLSDENKEYAYLAFVSRGIFLSVLERHLDANGVPTDGDYEPIKFVPVLIGEQDTGKSTLCRKIGLDQSGWYRATNVSFDQKQKFYEGVQGGVIVELKEGTQMMRDSAESLKAFTDETRLQYRKPYAVDATSGMKINFTMIVTTNNETILKDDTGNTRFYPVYMSRQPDGY